MRLEWESAEEINMALGQRVRNLRKRRKISQQELSIKSGVSLGSLKRFESTGQISLVSFTKLAMALNCVDEIKALFAQVPYGSIEEVINEKN